MYKRQVQSVLDQAGSQADQQGEKDFEDYDLGLMTMDFAAKVEMVETYLPECLLTPLDQAIEDVIKRSQHAFRKIGLYDFHLFRKVHGHQPKIIVFEIFFPLLRCV